MSGHTEPTPANSFQAGSTCPFCQEPIAEGQPVVACTACGSLHHDACWGHKGGCSSYHCDTKIKAEGPADVAEIIVTAGEAAVAVPPPKRVPLGGAAAARAFLVSGPRRISALALVSLVLAGMAMVGLAGVLLRNLWLTGAGVLVALVALAVAVIALVVINSSRKVYGYLFAGGAVLLAMGLVVVYLADMAIVWTMESHTHQVTLNVTKNRPEDADLDRMAPPEARAMRANVVITSQPTGAFAMQLATGSGVVLKIAGGKAWILTNRHVVTGGNTTDTGAGRQLTVLFYNGESSQATVAWLPPAPIDLAILECDALTIDRVRPVEVLRTTAVPGDAVFAVGNPENYNWSITKGIVSGMRSQVEDGQETEVYQTQTPINSGNSGGGLYTADGRLIGVNTWTHDKSVSEGLSFAISSRTLLRLLGDENIRKFLAAPAPEPGP
jgi:S1-C subfamily serine protease